jgi:prolyl oligopeptidase
MRAFHRYQLPHFRVLLFTLTVACLAAAPQSPQYPPAKKVDQIDDYHGVKVADPYRWLENMDSPETKAWIDAEQKVTASYLSTIPQREKIRARLTELWNYERFSPPTKKAGLYFFSRNSGLQNQSVLYVAPALTAEPRILLDPNTLSKDGTVALSRTSLSEDAQYIAYGVSDAGSDWEIWKVRRVATGQDLPDEVHYIKVGDVAWTHDAKGFFYCRYPQVKAGEELTAANYYHKVYYHRLGTPQADDPLIYERPDHKTWNFAAGVTDDGRYLIININDGDEVNNRVCYKDLRDPKSPAVTPQQSPIVELLKDADAEYTFIDNDGPTFWFVTNNHAPRSRIIAIDTAKPQPADWRELVPQAAEAIESANVIADRFVVRYLKDAATQVKIFSLAGQLQRDVRLPGVGTAAGFAGERKDKETFYSYASFTTPATIYRYDLESGQSTVFRQPKLAFNPDDYESKQIFYTSKDGTRVPMFITYRKGLKLDGRNPTYLYGYGGFNISIPPAFSVANLVWMEMGGVYAVANLRGGGEYGAEWHDAGKKLKKQNVFDDFIGAAEWLINNKYTSREKLAIGGGSNGGLLVGACLTQRPDLFGAALPDVGVMDMLRFVKFTEGWGWVTDYGSPENADEFKALYAYSPYHNIKPGTKYPATMVSTSDHDDRVVPAHSYKFAAALQAAQAGDQPILIRIETRAGHGAGKPTAKIIDLVADKWAFLTRVLGAPQ